MPDEPIHKCSKCGFLAARAAASHIIMLEVDEDWREHGVWKNSIYSAPFCLMRRRNFSTEYYRLRETRHHGEDIDFSEYHNQVWKDILQADYACSDFSPWQQGFSPKEHREMLDREWRIKHEDEVRQAVWAQEAKRDEAVERHHREQMDTLKTQFWWQIGILGIAIIVATVLAAMIEAGWIGRWFGL